jgi:hypothetical protein
MRCGFDLRSTAERRSRSLGSAQESQDGIRRIGCGVAILAGDQSAIAHDMRSAVGPFAVEAAEPDKFVLEEKRQRVDQPHCLFF